MMQEFTVLSVADNSGAKKVMCFRIIGGRKKVATVGDIIVVTVKEAIPGGTVKKSEVCRAVVVRTKKELKIPKRVYERIDK